MASLFLASVYFKKKIRQIVGEEMSSIKEFYSIFLILLI